MATCPKCGKLLEINAFAKNRTICKKCVSEESKQKFRRARLEALIAYSGNPPKCACCQESHIEFLAIDHIYGGGKKHRELVVKSSGNSFPIWLRKNNYPEGYRILCHNCNMATAFYKKCPHETNQSSQETTTIPCEG